MVGIHGIPQEIDPKVCWHHGDIQRLRKCLSSKYCDLYPLSQRCLNWWRKLGLKVGDIVQFSVQGKIVASGTIKSEPYDLASKKKIQPVDPKWSGAVDIEDIKWFDGGTCRSNPKFGSHKL